MTFMELEQAIVRAKVLGLNGIKRTQVGFKGQIRTIEFEEVAYEDTSANRNQ